MIKKIESVLPPTVITSPKDGTRYFVCGGIWQEVSQDFTLQDAYNNWLKKSYTNKSVQNQEKIVKVKSSDGKKVYTVVVSANKVSCSCTGFGFRNKCKHVDKVIQDEKQ